MQPKTTDSEASGMCACGVDNDCDPAFHRAVYCCECRYHDRQHCPMCVLLLVLIHETEQYLREAT